MPTYVYRCKKCGHQFELRQPFRSPKPDQCPKEGCDGEVTKVLTPPAIVFKGPGFHVNDYGRSGSRNGGNGSHPPSSHKPDVEKAAAAAEKTAAAAQKD